MFSVTWGYPCTLPEDMGSFAIIAETDVKIEAKSVFPGIYAGLVFQQLLPDNVMEVNGMSYIRDIQAENVHWNEGLRLGSAVSEMIDFKHYEFLAENLEAYESEESQVVVFTDSGGGCWTNEDFGSPGPGHTLLVFNTWQDVCFYPSGDGSPFYPSVIAPFSRVELDARIGTINGTIVAREILMSGTELEKLKSFAFNTVAYEGALACRETSAPSSSPTMSAVPSDSPSSTPSISVHPSSIPSVFPSLVPSDFPSFVPSSEPSSEPSGAPSLSVVPSDMPSLQPSMSIEPSHSPLPSDSPSETPNLSLRPSDQPSSFPSDSPSTYPSQQPSISVEPSNMPSGSPSASMIPSDTPSAMPSSLPSILPSSIPTVTLYPSDLPSRSPSVSSSPSSSPSLKPSATPRSNPWVTPSALAPTLIDSQSGTPTKPPALVKHYPIRQVNNPNPLLRHRAR
ncbi:alpha beta-propellor repeat-containing integrin [Nitzschia inconspicua]|uniref:Alpha beta-propellor repeat-containing integrin n=1 Tax=Nitzschia inconspicua TaxID=303405 RepID=A0A9K3KBE6_9STRA|nr:alpha beta-propellor repeat-containing integrin [Nitzschia inconspicua]KAG7340433.1 alpha beta-propellor repeat-containing integrin [Nitzschia inconspicua]